MTLLGGIELAWIVVATVWCVGLVRWLAATQREVRVLQMRVLDLEMRGRFLTPGEAVLFDHVRGIVR